MKVSVVVLPDLHPPAWLDAVRAAEQAGVRAVWTYDHLSWRDLRDGPWHAAVPLLAAAAGATDRVRLGTLVATPNFRHCVPFAKDVMTLDVLSGGRIDLGIGAGGVGADATVLGQEPWSPAERADRFEEWATLLDGLLREPAYSWAGRHYAAVDARMLPGCEQRPRVPFTVAAAGPRALALTARFGEAWVTYGPIGSDGSPEAFYAGLAQQAGRLDEALGDRVVGRLVVVGLDQVWPTTSPTAYDDFLGRVSGLGFDEVVLHWPRPDRRGVAAELLDAVLDRHR